MKKFAVLFSGVLLLINTAFAGGILTNTNQSAQFVRILSRNASTDLDAAYFNPAGLTQMKNGFYFALHNQSIFQTRTITSGYPFLTNPVYKGEVTVPVFPTAFAVCKINKWAFSAGFGPNGGEGNVKYKSGLPSFEKLISSIPQLLSANGIPTTSYLANMQFEVSKVFYGSQFNASFAINKHVSFTAGARVINAVNTYYGYIKDIKVNPDKTAYGFDGSMRTASSVFATLSGASSKVASDIQPYVSAVPDATLPQLVAGKQMTQATADALASGLGISTSSDMTISQIQTGYAGKAIYLTQQSIGTADKGADTRQTGVGITPLIGLDLHFGKLNIGLKYEHQTTLEVINATKVELIMSDGKALFPDKGKSRNDVPAIVAGGADYKLTDALKISGSYTLYLDKMISWGGNIYRQARTIDENYVELAFGAEFKLKDNFLISAGYMNSNTGVSEQFQSDFDFSDDSYTTGLGFQWNMNKRLVLDAGMMLTTYKNSTKTFTEAAPIGTYTETYAKDTFTVGFGIGYKIF